MHVNNLGVVGISTSMAVSQYVQTQTVQTSAAEAVKTTFTMAGYPAGHRAMLTSTGSCHLLGGSEDSSVHWGEFHKNVAV